MLFVVFSLDADRYALSGRELLEVLPLTSVKPLAKAPVGIAGVLDYHGVLLPVVDVSALALGRPATARLSSRILIAEGDDGRRIAIIAERVNQMLYREASDFTETCAEINDAPHLGPVTRDERGLVQWVSAQTLLTPTVREAVFDRLKEAA